ncbi:MAG: hypothetical protein WC325_09400, partial [Candidatus Bathyarchaeia archaeon]
MVNFGLNKWKVCTVVLIVALATVSFLALHQFESDSQPYVAAQPSFIDVTIQGEKKLGVNQTGQYQAVLNSSVSGQLSFSWSISPQDNKIVLISEGEFANLTFVCATEEPYMLSVSVEDLQVHNCGSGSLVVYDPYSNPSVYLGAYGASYSYMVEGDGLGWYHVISGSTGAVTGTPSTNLVTVTSGILTSMTSGTLLLNGVAFDLALMNSIGV